MQSQKSKGILKQNSLQINTCKNLRWDEEGIAEDDKHRGQYPKIEEAKTPFHYAEEEDDQLEINTQSNQGEGGKLDLNYLNKQLEKHMNNDDDEEDEEEVQRKKKEEFKKRRAQHYKLAKSEDN